jgi:hypothetical protein
MRGNTVLQLNYRQDAHIFWVLNSQKLSSEYLFLYYSYMAENNFNLAIQYNRRYVSGFFMTV